MNAFKGESPRLTFKFLNTYRMNKRGGFRLDESQPCIVINSYEELANQYIGDIEVPKINFSAFTLVLGHVWVSYRDAYRYQKTTISNSKSETTVTLHFEFINPDVKGAFCVASDYYFYEIVPKFTPKKKIKVQALCPKLP